MSACKNNLLMRTAEVWATASHAKRNQVGCVITKDRRIMATGYNGTLPGDTNICEDDSGKTKDSVAHAEQNALMFCARNGIPTQGCHIYVTLSPCTHCAKLIIAAGISKVFYKEQYRCTEGLDLLKQFGVEICHIF